MTFFGLVNRLLLSNAEGRKRNLKMRTYKVSCLNEKAGLLEWVNNTVPIQYIIRDTYIKEKCGFRVRLSEKMFDQMKRLARSMKTDKQGTLTTYRAQIVSQFPALLHKWFSSNFSVPTQWFEARLAYTRSAAVWSMVGHIVGLGDRHSQNILLDQKTAECVHVDFDVLFDKGLLLCTPELAPFRLTRNIIDGMGVTGYEGVFRHSCECVMSILREKDNCNVLINNLEAFVHDPLVIWFKKGSKDAHGKSDGGNNNNVRDGNVLDPAKNAVHSATHVLNTIRNRLNGVFNYKIDNVLSRNPDKKKKYDKNADNGYRVDEIRKGGQEAIDAIPLSVQGQVQKLITEATKEENLIQMYPGWMPFF
jgi:phosphatidylinositol kinase/protein kinase (PI-3  family)